MSLTHGGRLHRPTAHVIINGEKKDLGGARRGRGRGHFMGLPGQHRSTSIPILNRNIGEHPLT